MEPLRRAACSIESSQRTRRPFRLRFQRGDAMLEGLVAMVLFSIIALGITYALVRSTTSHRLSNAQNLLIGQMRSTIQSSGIAAGCPTTVAGSQTSTPLTIALASGANETVTKECVYRSVTLTPSGGTAKTVAVPVVTFSSASTSSNLNASLTLGN